MSNIVIVDDSQFLRLQLKKVLSDYGYNVVAEGKDGSEGILLYKKHRPTLLITDITMPGTDGIACLEGVMRLDPRAKVMICSAMGNRNMVTKAIKAGAKDFILKPFQDDRIIESVNGVIGEPISS